jgi:hypothetical protein
MEIVFATTTGIVSDPRTGVGVSVHHGTHWPADDPIVKAYPGYFTDDARHGLTSSRELGDDGYPVSTSPRKSVAAPVETATAAPGEKRARK